MLNKTIERCYICRADCKNNDLFTCDYMYICNIEEDFKTKEIKYGMTPNIMYAERLYYKPALTKICDYINNDMQNYEEKLKFEMVLVEFTTIVEKIEDKGE